MVKFTNEDYINALDVLNKISDWVNEKIQGVDHALFLERSILNIGRIGGHDDTLYVNASGLYVSSSYEFRGKGLSLPILLNKSEKNPEYFYNSTESMTIVLASILVKKWKYVKERVSKAVEEYNEKYSYDSDSLKNFEV